ncbi:MAG: HAD-IA family hydrolase [Firmicutes bacterium]|nr:HAD-IA family hydrolase [Bacillota bacterium]
MIGLAETAILFDLDGTLTDSGEGILNCAVFTLQYFGLDVPSRQSLRSIVGPPLRQSFLRLGIPAERIDEAVEVYRVEYERIGKYQNFPYPGVPELLRQLNAEGFPLYVATSKPEEMSVDILEHFGLAPYFRIIRGATRDGRRDSKSSVIAALMSEIGWPKQVYMVGDTIFDVQGAAAHGIPTIGVSWGYGDPAEMKSAGAISIADTTQALYQALHC